MPANRAVTLDDYATLAGRRLDPAVQAYFDGGAGDEHTLAANRADYPGDGSLGVDDVANCRCVMRID